MLRHAALKYRATGKALSSDPGDRNAAWMMQGSVIADRQEFKVFQSIVGFVSVPVVDVLRPLEASSQVIRHDDTMFKQVITADTN